MATRAPPVIDGDLGDPAWRAAPRYGGFHERKPLLGQEPPTGDGTAFSVLFDDEALYFAVYCDDHRPQDLRGRAVQRDSDALYADDAITIKLDPASDRRTTIGFALNVASGQLDFRGINESEFRVEFDAVWQGQARRTGGGWTAEFRIPFAALGLDPGALPGRVGLNLSRDHSRRNATYDWALLPPPFSPISASRYGDLLGLDQGPGPGKNQRAARRTTFALLPYLTGLFRTGAVDSDVRVNGGVDVRLFRGEKINAQLSINTDFAQADLDDQRINLTRFGLFFPEKRDFFLRDLEVFAFGFPGEAQALQTRRIGLGADGQPVPLIHGLKVTSRPTRWLRLGSLSATSLAGGGQPATLSLVNRALIELDGGSNVGVLMAYRQSLERRDDYNLVLGLDGALRGAGKLLLTGFSLLSLNGALVGAPALAAGGPGTGPGGALGAEVQWRGLLVRPHLRYAYYDPQLRADLGFFRRVGVHDLSASVVVEPRLQRAGLERLTMSVGAGGVASADASRLLDTSTTGALTLHWGIGFAAGVDWRYATETVLEAFAVAPQVQIPAGGYRLRSGEVWAETPGVWPVSGWVSLGAGDYYGGQQEGLGFGLSAQLASRLRFTASTDLTRSKFDDSRGELRTAALNGRLALGLTTKLGVDGFLAWNSLADLVRLQGRVRFRYAEGSDLFLVILSDFDQRRALKALSVLVKMTLQWPT